MSAGRTLVRAGQNPLAPGVTRWLRLVHTGVVALAPDPFDEDLERLLADPEVIARLDDLEDRRRRGELVLHDDVEVRRRLRERGVPLLDLDDE